MKRYSATIIVFSTLLSFLVFALFAAGQEDEQIPGWAGVTVKAVPSNLPRPDFAEALAELGGRGAMIGKVAKDGPADHAGLRSGDIIYRIDGEAVSSSRDFSSMIRSYEPGDSVSVDLLRRGEFFYVDLDLEEAPEGRLSYKRAWSGLKAIDLPLQLREFWGGGEGQGVLVGEIEPGSPAEFSGLVPGDMILRMDGYEVGSVGTLVSLIRTAGVGNIMLLEVSSHGTLFELDLELAEAPVDRKRAY
ncbi:MAG: PDZ domain-containing protein [Acidobacteriota bacterium]